MAQEDEIVGTACGDATSLQGMTTGDIGILDAVDLPIMVIGRDCKIARVNRAATTVLGLTASDIGQSPGNVLAGVENLDRHCAQVIADGAPCRRETHAGDRSFLLRIAPYTGSDGQIVGAVLTFTNVTAFRASIDQAIYEREYTKAILNTVVDPLVVLDAKLRVQTANRAFYATFGLSRDEAQGVSIRKLGNNEWEASEVWKSMETTLSGHTELQPVEIEREFPAIGRRTVVLEARRLAREGNAMILLAFRDITERKQAERTTSLLAGIVGSSDDAIVSENLDGRITSWNTGAEHTFGYKAHEAIGQHITLIIPPDRWDEETDILRRIANGERVNHFETVRTRKDGALLNISATISPVRDAAGRVIGASKVARDVTERRRVERAIAEQARLLDLSFDAIFVRDAEDRITYWNNGASRLYGFSREEALARVSHDLLHTEFPDRLERIIEQLQRDGRWSGELTHKCKDGTSVVVASRWALDRSNRGNQNVILETNSDITRQKQSEKVLRESEERFRTLAEALDAQVQLRTQELEERNWEVLEQSEQLRELSNRLLQTQDDERRHIARELHDSAGQLISVLAMSLASVDQNVAQDPKLAKALNPKLAKALKDSQDLLQQLNSEIRTMSYLLHPPLLDASGLPGAIRWYTQGVTERSGLQIDLNITQNFGRLPGEIELALFRIMQEGLTNVHRHSGSKKATIRIAREADGVSLEIEDEGRGISPERLARIQRQGSGVGITGIRERIRHFGGLMNIQSCESGTRISVMIPTSVAAVSAPETTSRETKTAG